MGLREVEGLFMVKQLIHMITAVALLLWLLNNEKKLRYHRLLVYLAGISLIMSLVVMFHQAAVLEIAITGGFVLVLGSATW